MTTDGSTVKGAIFAFLFTTMLAGLLPLPALAQVTAEEDAPNGAEATPRDSTYLGRITTPSGGESVDTRLSTDDLQVRFQGNAQNALASIPSVMTRQSPNQPGIEVNIRGMSGYGRVATMIDGVPQNFRNVAGHEASGGNMLYIHPELLAGVDVTRGPVPGADGSGTLTGAANFRTLAIKDQLRDGAQQGLWTRVKAGSNGQNLSGMMAFGQRFDAPWAGDGRIDMLLALAHSDNGNYRTGAGSALPDGPSGRASTDAPSGTMMKIDIVPSSRHALNFGLRTYDNTFQNSSYTWDVSNRTWTADYHFTPDNPLINLTIATYYNDTNLNYPGTGGSYAGRRTQEETYGISATNRAEVPLASGSLLELEYGLSWGRDDFQTHAMRGGNHPGKLDKASAFAEAELSFDRFSLSGGLRYDYWQIDGYRPPYQAGVADCPADGPACGDEWAQRDGGRLLPKIGAAYLLTPDLTLRASYAHTLRPPTTHEAFFALVPFGNGTSPFKIPDASSNRALVGKTIHWNFF